MEQRLLAHDAAFEGEGDDDERLAPAAYLQDTRYEPSEAIESQEWNEFALERIEGALEHLDERSRDIVVSRWMREPKAKLRELAEKYEISAERVRQIERDAFAELRNAVERLAA
jgi:RNA polymerase sigma-32 factor